jgi:uncharacterized protein YdiU (UPF0061 family)
MLHFDNRLVRELPGDDDTRNIPRQVFGALWSAVQPTPVAAPRLLAYSAEMARELGLDGDDLGSPQWLAALAGNALLPGMSAYATCYGGHQFGNWANQLGDGRAIFLGETVNRDGRRFELQLKGAGPTPYSRGADGRAVLRSSIREFLCSEAMHHLGVPTTRALSLVATGEAFAASRRLSFASAISSCPRRAATRRCCAAWSIFASRATSPNSRQFRKASDCCAGSSRSASAARG